MVRLLLSIKLHYAPMYKVEFGVLIDPAYQKPMQKDTHAAMNITVKTPLYKKKKKKNTYPLESCSG